MIKLYLFGYKKSTPLRVLLIGITTPFLIGLIKPPIELKNKIMKLKNNSVGR